MAGKTSLDAVLKRRQQAKEETERRKIKNWSCKEGRNKIRILPPWDGSEEFFKAFGKHFNLGPEGKTIVYCPEQTLGQPCPICAAIKGMYKGADEEMKKHLSSISAPPRFAVNIIDLTEPDKGVQVAELPRTVMEAIWNIMVDEEVGLGDITDPKTGYDIIIDRTGTGLSTKYDVKAVKAPSMINPAFLENINDLDKMVQLESYENLKLIFEGKAPAAITAAGPPAGALPAPEGTGSSSTPIDVEYTEVSKASDGSPPCFGSFSETNDRCLDCAEQDECELKMLEAKRAARKSIDKPKRTPTPAAKEEPSTDMGADDLLREMEAAIGR